MIKTVIFHKAWNIDDFIKKEKEKDHPGRISKNYFIPEFSWLRAVEYVVKRNHELIELWATITKNIENLGYKSLGQLIIKNTIIETITEGESFAKFKIQFIYDQRTLQAATRTKIFDFYNLLFEEMVKYGIIKKDKK